MIRSPNWSMSDKTAHAVPARPLPPGGRLRLARLRLQCDTGATIFRMGILLFTRTTETRDHLLITTLGSVLAVDFAGPRFG